MGMMFVLAADAAAAERLQFAIPPGWSPDAAEAKSRQADVYAVDTKGQPPAEMTGLRIPTPMFADDAFVRGFVRGLKKSTPGLVEVKHDFIDIGGQRAVRLIADVTSDGESYRQAYYVMPAGGEAACLQFTVARAAFDARLTAFDAIAKATRGVAQSAGR